jgi:hypothetical protein
MSLELMFVRRVSKDRDAARGHYMGISACFANKH